MSVVLLVMSNIFFVPVIYIAIKRKLYAEGLVYLVTMLFSSLYHACDQNGGQFCIMKYEVYHLFLYFDFFFIFGNVPIYDILFIILFIFISYL